ncbi:CCA tRNA nucleotidyltransferase, mitochondrial [Friedmanniomyces endolithicus]|nr:CCA tRNA nucleotidyltransferase, mitochondrial [Friedmanniomyces endolithicus]
MRNADIQDALHRKISRERVGVEMEKALRGPDPHEALRLVFDLDLYETIFSDPTVETSQHYKPDTEGWQVMIDTLEDALESEQVLAELLVRDDEERFVSWQLAALVPYRDAPQPEAPAPGRKAPPPIAAQVAKEGIKATNKVTDIVIAAVRNQQEISSMVDALRDRQRRPDMPVVGDDATARDVLGMAIRRWGPSWRSQAMYAFLVEVVENQGSLEATERKYTAFLQHLSSLSLLDAYTLKPLLDGKMLAKALNTPPGIWMKDALDVVMAWQLRHPGITDPQAAIEEVKQQQQKQGELAHALVRHFLKLTIRPLFAKTKPSTITAQGRKNTREVVLPVRMTMESEDEAATKPWKSGKDGAAALDLLRWVVSAMDGKLVEEVWHLIVPPLLTLLDDWEVKYKQTGAELLNLLLQSTPSSLLERTGLGEVFEEALMPCLAHLPSLTPEPDSIALLSAVYPTLLTLAKTRYPASPPPPSPPAGPNLHSLKDDTDISHDRIKLLDRILRKGIIQSHSLIPTHQHPRLIAVLLQQLVPLLDALGIQSVKHLQYLLPILTATLTDPRGGAAGIPTLRAGVQALRAVVLNCWPRFLEWRGEVLKGLALGWLRVEKEEGGKVEGLRGEMREVVGLMRVMVGEQVGFEGECAVLVAADGRLGGLLEVR